MMKVSFVIPGSVSDISGGHIFNREIAKSLVSEDIFVDLMYGKNKDEIIEIICRPHEILLIDAWCLHDINPEILNQEFHLLVHHPLELDPTLPKSNRIEQLFWNRAKSIIVTSDEVKKVLITKTKIPVNVVVPGMTISKTEKKYPLTPINVVGLGSYIERKGDLLLLETLQLTMSEIIINRYGPCFDSDYLNKLKTLVLEYKLSDRFKIHGMVSHEQKLQIFKSADLMVFPTLYESFGMAIQESLCYGIPVLTNDIPGLKNRFGEKGIRYLKPYPLAWAEALDSYTENAPDYSQLCNEFKDNSIKWPSWQQQARKIVSILNR